MFGPTIGSNGYTGQGTAMFFANGGGINGNTITGATIYSDTWPIWCDTATSTATTNVWNTWVNCTIINTTGITITQPQIIQRPATPEELRALAAQRERYATHQATRDLAETKARILLFDNLTPRQQEDLKRIRAFFVEGSSGIRYRIRHGRAGNVDAIDREGKIMYTLCAHPVEDLPDQDTMLAQKLMLEHDDLDFVRRANRSLRYGPQQILEPLH